MLASDHAEPEKISKYITGYLGQIISDAGAVEALNAELYSHKVSIIPYKNKFVLKSRENANINDVPLEMSDELVTKYLKWWMKWNSPASNAATG